MFALLSGGATGLIVLFGADQLAGGMMSLPKSAIALRVLAPTLLIVALMGVIRGYFQGLGSMMPTAISQLVEQIINAIVSVVAAIMLFSYGEKVGTLLHDSEYASAYGAAGGTLGTGAGALAGLLILVVMLISHNRSFHRNISKDPIKHTEEYGKIFRVLILTILPIILSTTIYNISDTLDQGIFNYIMDLKHLSSQKAELWGIFSTKYRVLTNVPIALSSALQAGFSAENALQESWKEMRIVYGEEAPICKELTVMVNQISLGIPLETVFEEFSNRTCVEDIATFSSVFQIAKRTGGDMVAIIRKTADDIASKIDTKNEISVLISSKKLEQNIMSAMPLSIILYLEITSGGMLDPLYGNWKGVLIMSLCLIVYVFAYFLSRKIMDIEV